jgi:hypothetical protein
MNFCGWTELDSAIEIPVNAVDASGVPTNSSTTPSYRVYGSAGLMANGTGSLTFKDTGSITGATNASPIVITSASHKLTTGMKVTITGVLGNTAANGTFTITVVNANTFSLDGSTGNGAYTSGGAWKVTGWYTMSITPTAGNGYAQGGWYDVYVVMTISASVVTQHYRIGVA